MTRTVSLFDGNMEIREFAGDRRLLMELLLLADEQPQMVERYMNKGRMFVLDDDGIKAECLVTDEGDGVLEIKNIAVLPHFQRKSYGKAMIDFLIRTFSTTYSVLQVGTGDSPLTVPFYEKCGFKRHHKIKDFFINNYDHPIIEAGVQLRDMVYLRREMGEAL